MLKTTLNFLTSLKANNNRDWFTDNKSEYLEAKSQFEAFVGKLIIVPEHRGPIELNVGVVTGFTVMVKVVVVAHCPMLGVKV